ncbi:MAG TPA: hypothetical protein VF495_03270, partial [Phenylobacterium sp.]
WASAALPPDRARTVAQNIIAFMERPLIAPTPGRNTAAAGPVPVRIVGWPVNDAIGMLNG